MPGPDASTRSDGPASRATRSAAPIVQAPDNQAPNGQAPNSQAPNGEAPSDAVTAAPPSATDAPSSGPAGPAPMQLTADPNHLAAEAALALEHVDFLMDAAAQVEAAVAEANETAAAVIAQQEAERKAAEERARKIAVAVDSANGAIPRDVLCAPAFAPDALLRCDAAEALDRLNAAYRADHGRDLRVVSSYRSYAMQVSTKASRGSLAARPGTSNHGRGIAVDLGGFGSVGQFNDPDYLWMREHAGEFGWYHPAIMRPGGGGPQEPWHWEYGTD